MGRVSGPCHLWGGLDIARDKVPIALLVGVKYFRKDLYNDIKGQYDWNNGIFKRCKFSKRPNPTQLQQIIFIFVCIKDELTYLKKRIIKVCLTKSADLSVFVSFFFYFFLLSYFSLPPPASLDFSVISQPISMKFGMLIVLDNTKSQNIFSSQ